MGERTQINIVTSPAQKQRWQEYVEESEASSLSHLIRLAVEREIAREQGQSDDLDVDLSAMQDGFERLETELTTMKGDIRTLIETQRGEQLEDLAAKVYAELPRVEDEELWMERLGLASPEEAMTDYDPDDDLEDVMGIAEYLNEKYITVEGLAITLEESEYRVTKAVRRVEESFARVRTHQYESELYVYEVV
ncbi:hypothetical protein ACLI4Q_10845 [Natrialbaceae archaeon A-CW1-1]